MFVDAFTGIKRLDSNCNFNICSARFMSKKLKHLIPKVLDALMYMMAAVSRSGKRKGCSFVPCNMRDWAC